MGECRIYKCACGYQKRLMIGAGRGAHSLDIASRTVPADIAVLLCDENGESRFTLSNSVISCGGCKELSTVTDLKYELEGKPVRYVSECPVCGKKNDPLNEIEKIRCPKCCGLMSYMTECIWD